MFRAPGRLIRACLIFPVALAGCALGGATDGSLLWPFTTAGYVASSPAIGPDGTIYIGIEIQTTPQAGAIYAINPDGSLKWQFSTPDWVDSSPAIAPDGTVYAGCWDGKLYALTSAGAEKWTFDTGSYIYSSPAVGPDGTVYVGAGDFTLHAIGSNGVERWAYLTGNWVDSSPAVAPDGSVYFGSWDQTIYGVNPDGTSKWVLETGNTVKSSPAIGADGTVYIGSDDGSLYAVSTDGFLQWTFATGDAIDSSPTLGSDGTIYLGSDDGYFYALNPQGTLKWKTFIGQAIVSAAVVRADGTIIFGAENDRLYALNSDGTTKWSFLAGDIIDSSPAVSANGTVYVGSYDGRLYAINGSGATAAAAAAWPMFHLNAIHTGATPAAAYPVNLSARALVGSGSQVSVAGFVISGSSPKTVLIRAVGPTLAQYGVTGVLAQPLLTLYDSTGAAIATNAEWGGPILLGSSDVGATIQAASSAVFAQVSAYSLPSGSADSAFVATLPPGNYTAQVGSSAGPGGVALAELYDADTGTPVSHLINISARAQVGTGSQVLVAGFVVTGGSYQTVLLRAVGPTLAQYGVNGVLSAPQLTLYDSNAKVIATDTGWGNAPVAGTSNIQATASQATSAVFSQAYAYPLPAGSADSAMLVTLPPGAYTAQVSGVGGATGVALAEVYVLQ